MYRIVFFIVVISTIFSCNNQKKIPDVSNIKIDVKVQRFEKDFFNLDTLHLQKSLTDLNTKYPLFLHNYIGQVLGFTDQTPGDTLSKYVSYFIRDYKFVKDSADLLYGSFDEEEKEIKKGLQFVKYYFPQYKLPTKITTFIGPFDGYSDILSADVLAIGLQLHMGSNFSFYRSDIAHDLFPAYITQRFTKEYIPVNAMKNIVDDLYPDKSNGKALIEQMVEKGKRVYLLDKFLPNTPDHLKLGYTEKQTKDCLTNEAVLWDFFLKNELLNLTDQNITKNYVGEGPKTQELGDDSPGNIGTFTGWQIVRKFMEKNPSTKPNELMIIDARELYNRSKYKPRA